MCSKDMFDVKMVYGMNKQAKGEAGGAQVGIQVGLLNLWEGNRKISSLLYANLPH